jgi:hypothetical protein
MKWIVVAVVVAVAAAIGVNALLLGYGTSRHDPVGRLSPVANLQNPPVKTPTTTTTEPTHTHAEDD